MTRREVVAVWLPGSSVQFLESYEGWDELGPLFERRPFGTNGTRLRATLELDQAKVLLDILVHAASAVSLSGREDARLRGEALQRAKLRLDADIRVAGGWT